MEKTTLELVGQWSAYIVVILAAFSKVISEIYKYFKNFKKEKEKKDTFTVNVNNPISSTIIEDKSEPKHSLYFLLEQGKIFTALEELKPCILKEQMDHFSKHIKTLKLVAIKMMLDILYEAKVEESNHITYFSAFENFLTICSCEIKAEFRSMCKTNHFSEYSSEGFRELTKRNIIILEGVITELLRTKFPQHEHIKNFKKMNEIKPMIRDALKDCFEYSRNTSFERINKINDAIECFEKKVSNVIGSKYTLKI